MNGLKQTDAYRRWEASLKDLNARAYITARLFRLTHGLMGDAKPVGEGVKGSQPRDILLAKFLAKNWIDGEEENESSSYRL